MVTQLESHRLSIGGGRVEASGEGAPDVVDPATEAVIASVPNASIADDGLLGSTQLKTVSWSAGRP